MIFAKQTRSIVPKRYILRIQFSSIAKITIIVRRWFQEVVEQHSGMNTKKRISSSVRTQQQVGVLTHTDKTILDKFPSLRTIPERQHLVKLIAGLPMFARLPPKVRARLATVINFVYLNTGRKLIHQGNEAIMMYFVVSGEIAVTKNLFDSTTNTVVERFNYITGPGDWVGEVELLEECPRRQNYITLSDVELLAVDFDNFNTVLKPVMSQIWKDKKTVLTNLGYFDHFNEEQIISACHLGILRRFEPLETIYYEDKGQATYVHFVVSGECMILQYLKTKVIPKGRTRTFELMKVEHSVNPFSELSAQEIMEHLKQEAMAAIKSSLIVTQFSDDEAEDEKVKKKMQSRKVDIKAIEIKCGLRQPSSEKIISAVGSRVTLASRPSKLHRNLTSHSKIHHKPSSAALTPEHSGDQISTHTIEYENTPTDSDYSEEFSEYEDFYDWSDSDMSTNSSEFLLSSKKVHGLKSKARIENHFIDVGSIIHGGIFGLGEKMEHRVIMARTAVQCLLLPRFWITAKAQNAGNVWQQRRIRLDFTIPSRQSLFNDFLNTRNWQVFKQNFVEKETNVWDGNPTKIQDIPVIGRIVEHDDY